MCTRRSFVLGLSLLSAVTALAGCGSGVHLDTISVSVDPLPTDDLSGPCSYDLIAPDNTLPQAAVLVVFERGDSDKVFQDMAIRQLTYDLHIAQVFAHQCNAASYDDLQSDAGRGPARALSEALTQFATMTQHPEISSAPVILYGFSAAGALSMTMAEAMPDRVLGAISYAPGSAYLNVAELPISDGAAHVPMLIMANARDQVVGTYRNKKYFERGHALGAPWAYAVQNSTGHCCNQSTLNLIVPWIRAMVSTETAADGNTVKFSCAPDGVLDSYGSTDCSFTSAALGTPASATAGSGKQSFAPQDSGWLPDAASAQAWLSWVSNPNTN